MTPIPARQDRPVIAIGAIRAASTIFAIPTIAVRDNCRGKLWVRILYVLQFHRLFLPAQWTAPDSSTILDIAMWPRQADGPISTRNARNGAVCVCEPPENGASWVR